MDVESAKITSEGKVSGIFRSSFRLTGSASSSTSSSWVQSHFLHDLVERSYAHSVIKPVSSIAKPFLPSKRRLRLDPPRKLYFPYEPGKQVRSAIKLKNISKSRVAFKFQTTAPKSCYMRPPGGVLAAGESLTATVFKFVEPPENNEKVLGQKNAVKFKIMSLKMKGEAEYVPELFDELKDQITVEQILRVVFLDPERPSAALERLKEQLAEAVAEVEAFKKPPEDAGQRIIGEGMVIDEWKLRRERYLAEQRLERINSM